jgi:diketogulonate reductase-like aldo/keto reductase
MLVMAYSPIEQGRLVRGGALADVARRRGVTPAQVALAWTVRSAGVMAIPKATRPEHVRENAAAGDLVLDDEDLRALDRAFPAPGRAVDLEML